MEKKKCSRCEKKLDLNQFARYSKSKDGRQGYCKVCQREVQKEYISKNRAELNRKRQEWREAHPGRDALAQKKWKEANPELHTKHWKGYNLRRRLKVLRCVSDSLVCVRCGCDRTELLEINHKNGGGRQEMKNGSSKFHAAILKGTRSVDDLELLCKVCNTLHYVEMKYGPLPYTLTWGPSDGEESQDHV